MTTAIATKGPEWRDRRNHEVRALYRIFEVDLDMPATLELIGTRVHPEDIPLLQMASGLIARADNNIPFCFIRNKRKVRLFTKIRCVNRTIESGVEDGVHNDVIIFSENFRTIQSKARTREAQPRIVLSTGIRGVARTIIPP